MSESQPSFSIFRRLAKNTPVYKIWEGFADYIEVRQESKLKNELANQNAGRKEVDGQLLTDPLSILTPYANVHPQIFIGGLERQIEVKNAIIDLHHLFGMKNASLKLLNDGQIKIGVVLTHHLEGLEELCRLVGVIPAITKKLVSAITIEERAELEEEGSIFTALQESQLIKSDKKAWQVLPKGKQITENLITTLELDQELG